MKIIVVEEQPGQGADYITAASKAGWELVCESDYERIAAVVTQIDADAAVLIARRVNEVVLQTVRLFNSTQPMPVVLYTGDSLQQSIRDAVNAGVSAYVVDCRDASRIGAHLDISVIRFAESQKLKKELQKAKTSLAERNSVDKAKGIIMQQRNVSEDAAYKMLRKLAMDRNRRIGEVAGEVIAAAEVLI